MIPDLTSVFKKYEALRCEADAIFSYIEDNFPECVKCRPGCSDCCNALFDLSLVEAMYINQAFNNSFDYGPERSIILERAADVDRSLARLKKGLYYAEKNGQSPDEIMKEMARHRMRCPLLNDNNECSIYESRPITCRLYGIPQQIGQESRVCGFSAFEKGKNYPTVQIGKIQGKLDMLAEEVATITGSRFKLTEIYVPLSMALLTEYDDKYLGVGKETADD